MIGWGRFQTFEYGCCIAFNDSSYNVRSYVIIMLFAVLILPFCKLSIVFNFLVYYIYSANDKGFLQYSNLLTTFNNLVNTSLAAPGALAHRLQRRTACKTQNGHQEAPKWSTGFFDPSTPSMRKGDNGEKKMGKKRGEKIMMKIVVTNVVASRPPEW